jgi:hypothetical protein
MIFYSFICFALYAVQKSVAIFEGWVGEGGRGCVCKSYSMDSLLLSKMLAPTRTSPHEHAYDICFAFLCSTKFMSKVMYKSHVQKSDYLFQGGGVKASPRTALLLSKISLLSPSKISIWIFCIVL